MAQVRLADIIDVEVFMDLPAQNTPTLTAFAESGIITRDERFDVIADAPGRISSFPFWNDLTNTGEPNYSSDDPAVLATPDKVGQDELAVRKAHLNNGWSAMDLARELQTGEDAMQHIRNRTDKYWDIQFQKRLINTALGVFNDNVANDSGDMVNDISIETTVGVGAANWFSRAAFTGALFTAGDHFDDVQAIAVHSTVYKRMVDNDDIDFIPDSAGSALIPFFLNKRVIVDDSCPTIAGTTSGTRYVSILFGVGAFGVGVGSPVVPVEVDRVAASGNGSGEETLWTRKTWVIQPQGFDFLGANLNGAGANANLSDLALATNWNRKFVRKNIPITFLVTNG